MYLAPRWRGSPWNFVSAQGVSNASMMGLPDCRKSFKIDLVVLIQYRLWQTPIQPVTQPRCRSKDAAYYVARVIISTVKKTVKQWITQCEPNSKAQKWTLKAARSTTVIFLKNLQSTLLIVRLKAGKLVKLPEDGRLFHALMTLLAKKFILTVQPLRGLYNLYVCPLVPVNCENSKNIGHGINNSVSKVKLS